MNAADLVTIGVQKVAQVHETHVALAWSRRIFRGSATVGYCYVVEFLYLLWRAAFRKPRNQPWADGMGRPRSGVPVEEVSDTIEIRNAILDCRVL